ncbi:MAG TPA: hypothetical protein PLC89_07735 [Haliscomenobacter sp.]|uniref:hypothetical protein n=1 Tax=Haliscomenobacter sp. TaxID=2717303 RepID=UPI002B60EB5B|nr:hypothetical protein [Haliscomenobacter sp.]HOY17166.1 hypothetical protein [Haliscomenobacter sp.]HPH20931.1 hypothetical protein [Haliscomenobacter sp.]
MGLFDRLFRTTNAADSTVQLDIKFGRYTDSYKTPLHYKAWEQSLALFEEDKYLDAYRAFFQYLRDEREDNVRWWTDEGVLRFEFYQGSKKITGYANEAKLQAEAKIAYSEALNVGFMRRLIERNFILQFSRFALDPHNHLCILFDTPKTDASPHKLYMALRELAINADKQDDLLLDEFKMLQAVEADHLQEVPLLEKEAKYTFIQEEITNTIQEINHGPLNREQYPGAIAYLLLHLVFKLDYLIKPEGYMMEELERIQRQYFAKDNKSNIDKNLSLAKDLQKLLERPKEELFKEMYRVRCTFGITTPVTHDKLVALIDTELPQMDWYCDNGYPKVALSIPGFIVSSGLFNYALPKPDRDLLHLYMQITEPAYFRALGFKNDFLDLETAIPNRRAVKKAVEDIVEDNKAQFPRFNPRMGEVDFSSLPKFARTYLLMMKGLELG